MGRTSRIRHQKKRLTAKELTDKGDENLIHLKSWLLTNNCLLIDNLIPFDFPITGRGLKTLKDIKINEALIRIPYKMLITTTIVYQSDINFIFSKDELYSAQCVLSVFLLYELHLNSISKWYYYINSLPQVLTNPDFCTQKEKSLLPTIIIDYMNEHHKVEKDYQSLIRSVNRLNKAGYCNHCNMDLKKILTFERYKWAYYIVNTRAIYIDIEQIETKNVTINIKQPNNLALAPFLDLFNHDIDTTVHASLITDEKKNKFYEITTLKSFSKESQVFINYGSHNSLKLYVHYGFFIPSNTLDEIYFNIFDVQACFNISKFKLDFIMSNNLQKNMAFTREGLNYNASCTLFILSTTLKKEQWNVKIYGNSFTSVETLQTYNTAKKILNLKRDELINHLRNMQDYKCYTQSFCIAINLVEEYLAILTESNDYMCMFH